MTILSVGSPGWWLSGKWKVGTIFHLRYRREEQNIWNLLLALPQFLWASVFSFVKWAAYCLYIMCACLCPIHLYFWKISEVFRCRVAVSSCSLFCTYAVVSSQVLTGSFHLWLQMIPCPNGLSGQVRSSSPSPAFASPPPQQQHAY